MSDLIGKSLGRYHILEQLGEGGMATVYKAYDTRLETDVAVKVIRTENILPSVLDRALKRFEREAKALARLTHPNIVKVTDFGEYEGKPYLVMPYFPGGTLKQKLGKPIPWQEAIQILLPIAEALDYAHSLNIVHRDVKPSNILLTQRGQPMLTDFGIAKILDLEETMDLTGTSAAVGTPEYMAPEQASAKTVDHRADIYALGVVLYEMVTGRKPFSADTPMAVLIKHATEPLPRPKQYVPSLPDGVEKILLKALAKQPENRYQDMDESASAFRGMLGDKVAQKKSERAAATKLRVKVEAAEKALQKKSESAKRETAERAAKAGAERNTVEKTKGEKVERYRSKMIALQRTLANYRVAASSILAKPQNKAVLIFAFIFFSIVVGFTLYVQTNNSSLVFSGVSNGEVGVYMYDGETVSRITQVAGDVENWSPVIVGQNIYFTSNRTGKAEIFGMRVNGETWQITKTPGEAESWSPVIAGQNIYFTSNRTGKAEIFRMGANGDVLQITNTPGEAGSWSPVIAGQTIYFTSNRTGQREIFGMRVNGDVWQITKTPGEAGSWSPAVGFRGNIYFTSDRTGKAEIFGMNANGEVWQVTNTPGEAKSWSPVIIGQHLYFTSDRSGQDEVYELLKSAVTVSEMESWTKMLDDSFPGY